MKTEKEIRRKFNEILESGIPLDKHMEGYLKALKWVLDDPPLFLLPFKVILHADKQDETQSK